MHVLWEWKSGKNPAYGRGYHVTEGLLRHPSTKYGVNMEGAEREPERPTQADETKREPPEPPKPRRGVRVPKQEIKREPGVKREQTDDEI